MNKSNNRNSRDDKSKPGNRSTTGKNRSEERESRPGRTASDSKPPRAGERSRERSGTRSGEQSEERPRTDFKAKDSRSTGGAKPFGARPARDGDRQDSRSPREGERRTRSGERSGERSNERSGERPTERSNFKSGGSKPFGAKPSRDGERPAGKSFGTKGGAPRDAKPRAFKEGSSKEYPRNENRSYVKKDNFDADGERPFRTFDNKKSSTSRSTDSRPFRKREDENGRPTFRKPGEKPMVMRARKEAPAKVDDGLIRLNRYISNAGICSRRKADELIAAGVVSVNGEVVSELGHKVDPAKDDIRYNGELLKREKKVYVLLNKPKDYITTTDDPQERRTVMALVEKASRERIYPVGRLDRNTTGLLLLTNDGDLADKLSHPRNSVTKMYHVELSRSLSQGDLNKIEFGLELEDGIIKPDSVSYVAGASKKEIGIQIHSGKNRIVRRIFEHLGYDVVKLDRVVYGNLTKKDLPRGRWRYLEEHELIQIKHLIK
ncbi:pseudouridine synthase [Pedobacter sp. MC2016-14]|uniref:pseudouridine synthase n=1 Tax=Pedobacter sp. MC2016-14 TaxID=2897327 RepID=UPI001E384D8A|nr:pseudouridine synthase [Pedobacter sp. MC2016-14]MCD0487939.1 pseudouridine synthase [Pedobacter sp. MC2016-14]